MPTVPLFRVFYRLCKQGNWFSFESRTGKRAKKCFEEQLSGLKGWKDYFFLIDRRAAPIAMPWRHRDSKVTDKFPEGYSERDARKVASKLIVLRKPPDSLLYEYGLSRFFRIMGHRLVIKDAGGHGNNLFIFIVLHAFISSVSVALLSKLIILLQ